MDAIVSYEPRLRRVALPARRGEMALLDFGPPERPVDVIFSHANGFNARTYRTILAPLAGDLRILAVDMRGHGASSLPAVIEGREGWHEFREDLLALLDAVADRPVVLAGHSLGGTTSLLAAAVAPSKVKALALFEPVIFARGLAPADMTDNPMADAALRRRAVYPSKRSAVEAYSGRGAFRSWRPEQLADYVEAGFRETEDGQVTLACTPAWEASTFRTHNYDPWAAFRAIRCPVRILRAKIGSSVRVERGQAELEAAGRVRIDAIAGTSHFLPMERPDLVREALREMAR